MMIKKSLLTMIGLSLIALAQAEAKKEAIQADQISIMSVENCRSIKNKELSWLPSSWSEYKLYTKVCPLNSKGKVVLSILTVDYQQYSQAKKQQPEKEFLPLILGSKGDKLGELPAQLLPNGPTWLQLVFWSWEDNFPQRIVPLQHNISVSPSEALHEMYWDPSEKVFKTVSQ